LLFNRGSVLFGLSRYQQALESFQRVLLINPAHVVARYNCGVVLDELMRYDEALSNYDRALELKPNYADALNNRGVILDDRMRYEEALASYDRALAIMPNYADALNNRGGLRRRFRMYEKSALDYSQLANVDPDYAYVLGNKLYSNMQICNWHQYPATKEQLLRAVRGGKRAVLPFQLLVISDSGAEQLTCAVTYADHKYPLVSKPLWRGERFQHARIRIAYLSSDFRGHATAYLMAELFEKHDRDVFQVSAWSFGPNVADDMHARLRRSFEQFHDVSAMRDVEVAAMLRAEEIDIAIDLKGYTTDGRTAIFAHRAVPIQVNYLGYPGTMGARYFDYIIGDADVIPVGHEAFYTEKVVRLPDTYQVNDSKRVISNCTPSRAEVGLPESGFVFCCFNNNFKIGPDIFNMWMRLLKRVESSVLWLYEDNAAALRNLRLEAESRGVRADRLVPATRMPLPEHLARHRLADLFLDTLPVNAHTTASDALWAGLPVLTCTGNTFAGRVATSLLRAIGLPELIAGNLTDYEALALKLATTPALLSDIRAKLAKNRNTHPLFDTDRFRRHIESAYTTMYDRYQRGEVPQSFAVQPMS
jgi:predicted O-linked N-acetylglucosamine transferase (SPINDLY family)